MAKADELSIEGKYREAAALYIEVNFQRKAIDLLEKNQLVDEAARVLNDMKLPVRAGVVYERNNQAVKAAECFIRGKRYDLAAKQYEVAASTNPSYYRDAAAYYEKGEMMQDSLRCLHKLLRGDEIFRICMETVDYSRLAFYASLPSYSANFLHRLRDEELAEMVSRMELTSDNSFNLAYWFRVRPDRSMLGQALKWSAARPDLAAVFWRSIRPRDAKVMQSLMSQKPPVLIFRNLCLPL